MNARTVTVKIPGYSVPVEMSTMRQCQAMRQSHGGRAVANLILRAQGVRP